MQGQLHIYTGDGKGKTTASIGIAIRCAGWGGKILIVQFLKEGVDTGEGRFLANADEIDVYQFGEGKQIVKPSDITSDLIKRVEEGLEYTKNLINTGEYDLLILDEINIVLDMGIFDIDEFINILKEFPKELEVVLTGRNAPAKLIEKADLVSEIKSIKHYFTDGLKSRKGIEY
jgi:cob(I)alamin adenosyltransferase